MLALQEAYLPDEKDSKPRKKGVDREEHVNTLLEESASGCQSCGEKHPLRKCKKYQGLQPAKRYDLVRKSKLCFNCLQNGHTIGDCTSRYTCFEKGCSEKHHTSLHQFYKKKKEKTGDETVHVKVTSAEGAPRVILQIVAVCLHGPDGSSVTTYALLDPCSQSTLVRDDIARKINLTGRKCPVNVVSATEKSRIMVSEVEVDISSCSGDYKVRAETSTYVLPKSKFNMPSRPSLQGKVDPDVLSHLHDIDIEAVSADDVTILIGANVPAAVLTYDVRFGSQGQVLAVQTKFGWTLFGPSLGLPANDEYHTSTLQVMEQLDETVETLWDDEDQIPTIHVNSLQFHSDMSLHEKVENFWKQENCGITPVKAVCSSAEDESALERMEKETVWTGEKYEVPMLWDSPNTELPDNYAQARRRYGYAEKKYRANRELHSAMNKVITGYLHTDPPQARKMTPDEAAKKTKRSWTLPIHAVVSDKKPGKVRVVNNAAAVFEGTSLNDHLVTGPDLLNSLVGILMRFRFGKVAIAADVEAMYHQVRVPKEDAESLRFLWKEDIDVEGPPDVYQMLVHIFGAKDSSGCANYAMRRTARDNYEDYDALTYESVLNSFYVDDLLKSLSSTESAIKVAKELISMLSKGGFRLTKFTSNSKEVLDALPQDEVSPTATINLDSDQVERALGVLWETKGDVFLFSSNVPDAPVTKRGILKVISSVFDPLGFLSPFTIKVRIILQSLWVQKLDWDEEVGEESKLEWSSWLDGVRKVDKLRIARQYTLQDKPIEYIQLHVFCDASEAAYGCAAYVRFSYKDGSYSCCLVMSKSRLAPLKVVTLPRLELNAARAGARLSQLIVHEIGLPIEKIFYWSDSTITLQYISNRKLRLKV